ncbi:MAG: FHA domain-containing protein [Methyloprofundus sp.]|nr:FHA domain-containing protein [Methyloprofundus sp.]
MYYIEVYSQSILQSSFKIERETYVIGRSEDADICLNNTGVSNIHAVIQYKDNQLSIKDLNSTNGILLNNQKITKDQVLRVGDTLVISKYILKVGDWASKAPDAQEGGIAPLPLGESDSTIIVHPATKNVKNDNDVSSYLLVNGDKKQLKKVLLNKPLYRIGVAKDSDIQLFGWKLFSPKYAAEIKRVGDVFYIMPLKKGYVSVNGGFLTSSFRLTDNDKIKIKKLTLHFINEKD